MRWRRVFLRVEPHWGFMGRISNYKSLNPGKEKCVALHREACKAPLCVLGDGRKIVFPGSSIAALQRFNMSA